MDNNSNEEVVSKNFIEQIIEKDLAEGSPVRCLLSPAVTLSINVFVDISFI